MVRKSTEKYNSFQPLFLFQLYRHIYLVLKFLHMLKYKCILFAVNLPLKNLNHIRKKRIADTFNQYRNGIRIRTLEIARAVIRYVIIFFNRLHNHLLRCRIDIRMIVNRP